MPNKRTAVYIVQAIATFTTFLTACSAPSAQLIPIASRTAATQSSADFRPPSVPLIVRQPYVSTWQGSNTLNGHWASFWAGQDKAITGVARIDGKSYTFMGAPVVHGQPLAPKMTQTSLEVTPTQSIYTFEHGGVVLVLDFLSPVEPADLKRQSVPLGYIFASAHSNDGAKHAVKLYFDISGQWADGDAAARITWKREPVADTHGSILTAYCVEPAEAKVLGESGDSATWGQAIWAARRQPGMTTQAGADTVVRSLFVAGGTLDNSIDSQQPRAIDDHWPVFAFTFNLGQVGSSPGNPITLMLGDVRNPAVSYQGVPIAPLWRSSWPDWQHMLASFSDDAEKALARNRQLDTRVTSDATKAGGAHYAALCDLALRQAVGATELVGTTAHPWMFMKEISSDGNISTIDVLYPSFPAFLYLNPELLRLQLDPLFAYAESGKWPQLFAEHDIGSSYPNADGHNDGGGENMPVEESANMLIMSAAYLRYAPRAEAQVYARLHYKILKQWANYLLSTPPGGASSNALDPQFQNQTDDFTGPIAHSVNLALKGILGVGAMGEISNYANKKLDQSRYVNAARAMIGKWAKCAQSNSGPHLTMQYVESPENGHTTLFPRTGLAPDDAWSLKYNMFPDRVLGLNLIPKSVIEEEANFYKTRLNAFGVPLDIRHTYTKADWELWTAAATDDTQLRQDFINAAYKFADNSNARVPFSDWYDTISGQQVGFQARPVIGGLFAVLDRTALKANQ